MGTNVIFFCFINLLYGNHDDVDNSNIVDGPSNPFGFIIMSSGFSNTEAYLDAPH